MSHVPDVTYQLLQADNLDIKLINFQLKGNSSMLKLVSCLLSLSARC
jgi:hypothetical protein